MSQNQVTLPPTVVNGSSVQYHTGFDPRVPYISVSHKGQVVYNLATPFTDVKNLVKADHQARQQALPAQLDAEINAIVGPVPTPPDLASIDRTLQALASLITARHAALAQARLDARAFSGGDPSNLSFTNFAHLATGPRAPADPFPLWSLSYQQAWNARLLEQAIAQLAARQNALAVARIEAARTFDRQVQSSNALDLISHHAELALATYQQARVDADTARRELARQLMVSADHLGEPLDRLDTAQAAGHAQELEVQVAALMQAQMNSLSRHDQVNSLWPAVLAQQAQLSGNASRYTPTALPHVLARVDRIEQRLAHDGAAHERDWPILSGQAASLEQQAQEAMEAAYDERLKLAELQHLEIPQRPATFALSLSTTALPWVIASAASSMTAFEPVLADLRAAVRGAVRTRAPNPVALAAVSVLMFASHLGERYGLGVPLADLLPEDRPLPDTSTNLGGKIPLPSRLVSEISGENSQILVVPTGEHDVPADVRVRAASWDASLGGYRFTTEGPGPVTLLWTPQVVPGESSTSLPNHRPPTLPYPGSISVPSQPVVLGFPHLGEGDFDDYIVTFPADSGLDPVYVMFKNPRHYPGVAQGYGKPVSGRWLEPASGQEGAPIPAQIADVLRGQRFASFDRLREAFWKSVAQDPELRKQFTRGNLERMLEGAAPKAQQSQWVGSRGGFELHHIDPIANGGPVYDLDNLAVTTPKTHIGIHGGRSDQ